MAALPKSDSPLMRRVSGPITQTTNELVTGDGERKTIGRTVSSSSTRVDSGAAATPSRSGTLRKNASIRKRASLSRRASKRSLRAGSMRGMGDGEDDESFNNVFYTPIPTQGNPTEMLANRFQAWRKLLKDLIAYFREIQSSYESRSKALLKVSNVINSTHTPSPFMTQGGLNEALNTLRGFHKISLTEANKSKDIEEDVITQLNGLRNDLNQKIKEIKSLAGDFKNSVDKEREGTRKAVEHLKDALAASDNDVVSASGKNDPFIVRLAVDRQVERQIEEENYLHRAYLNLEGSGRELESIVVGEIQKAYNAYAGIMRRETEHAHEAIDDLRAGPIAMPKDQEWTHFVETDEQFINPDIPLRRLEDIHYPGKYNPSASELRGGMLERKSKYLKSYTPGWYVLSPTHLHEFKSADHIHAQQPVMSLYLLDQKLGSHSQPGTGSHKFSLKGRQSGAMHRGHSWVFRAESYETMMAWYDDIKSLTEKTGAARTAFVRSHARSVSGGSGSHRAMSMSSDGLDEDEADVQPYAANVVRQDLLTPAPKRPNPGGRFPSDVDVHRGLTAPVSPSDRSSSEYRGGDTMINSRPAANSSSPFSQQQEAVDRRDYFKTTTAPVIAPSALEPEVSPRQQVQQLAPRSPQPSRQTIGSRTSSAHSSIGPGSNVLRQENGARSPGPRSPGTRSPSNLRSVYTPPPQEPPGRTVQPAARGPSPSQPSAYSKPAPVDGTNDRTAPAFAALGGVAGGAGAYALHQYQAEDGDLDQAAGPGPAVVDGPYESHHQDAMPIRTRVEVAPNFDTYAEPPGSPTPLANGVSSSTQPTSFPFPTSVPSVRNERPTPLAETPPPLAQDSYTRIGEPTLPDLSSAAFAGATPKVQAVSQPGYPDTEQAIPKPPPPPSPLVLDGQYQPAPTAGSGTETTEASSIETAVRDEQGPASSSSAVATNGSSGLRETGRIFPLLRHATALSVSQLHVPGEFPPTPAELE